MPKKTFNEKLQDRDSMSKIVEIDDPKWIARFGGTRLLISSPLAYDEVMQRVPEGKLITADLIRGFLARKYDANDACPLAAGIFINIAARASIERRTDETPYWRTLKKDGELNEKYPGGIEEQKFQLESEGHTIIQKGKRYFVKDFKDKLFAIGEVES